MVQQRGGKAPINHLEALKLIGDQMRQLEIFTGENARKILAYLLDEKKLKDLPAQTFAGEFRIDLNEAEQILDWIHQTKEISEIMEKPIKRIFKKLLTILPLTDRSCRIWKNLSTRTQIPFEDVMTLLNPLCEKKRLQFFTGKTKTETAQG